MGVVGGLFRAIASLFGAGSSSSGTTDGSTAATVVASGPASSPLAGLQTQADRVRDAAKWLLATLGAVAAILVAGLKFSAIGTAPSGWRTAAAIGGSALAIAAVVFLIGLVLAVVMPGEATVDQMAALKAPKELKKYVQANPSLLQGYGTVEALSGAYTSALVAGQQSMAAYHRALRRAGGDETAPAVVAAEKIARAADARASYLDEQVAYVTKSLAVEELQHRFSPWRRFLALVAAAAIGAGLGAYAWGTNAPKAKTSATTVSLAGATLAGLDLTRAGLAGVDLAGADLSGAKLVGASLAGAKLSGADLSGADLKGADLSQANVKGVHWKNTTCPDGTNSNADKKTCKGHLGPSTS